jgi:hypothetical protein
MSDSLLSVLVGGGLAIVGSAVTGFLTYVATVRQRETESYKHRLIQAYGDIAAFHRLEERYVQKLAAAMPSTTAESWKRNVRREQRRADVLTPSPDATAQKAEQYIQKLS